MRIKTYFLFFLISFFMLSGCTLVVDIKTPVPSDQKFSESVQQETSIVLKDSRVNEDRNLSIGKINYVLNNMKEDEVKFFGTNLEKELLSRGINAKNAMDNGDLELDIKKYQIINIRTSGFHPLWTYTMFAADLNYKGKTQRVAFYWLADKTPIWSMDEVNEPCFNIPISLMIKEIAAKVNSHSFDKKAPSSTVSEIADAVAKMKKELSQKAADDATAEPIKNSIPLKVLELGYTNNRTALQPLLELLKDEDIFVRVAATSAIGMIGSDDQFGLLKKTYSSTTDIEQAMALKSIGDLGTPQAVDFMKTVKKSPEYDTQMIRLVVDLFI